MLPRGLVLVTGPTGSGKSTTLAALVDLANRTAARPHHDGRGPDRVPAPATRAAWSTSARSARTPTPSPNALKHVLRQDPDIILVGEMRDLETISVALTAAETGHLVFATLHTQDAAQTIDRVIDVFPPHQQQQVRVQLAGALQGVVCQTLCKTADGKGRAVATEVLVATPADPQPDPRGQDAPDLLRDAGRRAARHAHPGPAPRRAGASAGRITYETGLEKCHHVEDFNRLCRPGLRGRDHGTRRRSSTRSGTAPARSSRARSSADNQAAVVANGSRRWATRRSASPRQRPAA